jgi:hypothetical protein
MSQIAVQAHTGGQRREARRGDTALETPVQEPAPASTSGSVAAAISAILTYIPTEIIIVYAAVTAAIDSSATHSYVGQWVAFWLFLALTPVANWCFYAGMLRGEQQPLPWLPRMWPWYGLVTATVAFALWGFTLPATPFKDFAWYDGSIGAPVLLVGSMVLGFAGTLFGPTTAASAEGS